MTVAPSSDGNLSVALNGYPNGVRIVEVKSDDARWLADLALHRSDLLQAEIALQAIVDSPALSGDVHLALWRSAIAQIFKCFGDSKSRSRLDSGSVLVGASHGLIENFKYYKAQRNKHMIHDENPYSQVAVVAILNDGSHPNKLEDVKALTYRFTDLNPQAHFNLSSLLRWIQGWTEAEFNTVIERIRIALEAKTMSELQAMPAPKHRTPTVQEASQRRQRN